MAEAVAMGRCSGRTCSLKPDCEHCIANSLPAENPRNFITASAAGIAFAHQTDRATPILDKK
jgi:hypothetical protein